jgi:hypothetical protein
MERYFTTVALLGVNDGNLPVHRLVTLLHPHINILSLIVTEV